MQFTYVSNFICSHSKFLLVRRDRKEDFILFCLISIYEKIFSINISISIIPILFRLKYNKK